ncbi:AraC family transcriptional regulator [Chryseobacterium sp. T16E-39]|uniref:helix-turn-helix domain-containing protein n=1 Tax=Chryseobacterium sp. T16E-39 TaxID=2015076 RepID=UPI000B5B2D7A|nr:AraC family transcriptional regulator [Chryseobacterium sp. T16E-39]ASK32110.1 AraC family transcriptional regulator [Chryseobacterium sp. T16E-39]
MKFINYYEYNHKMFGYLIIDDQSLQDINTDEYNEYIRILFFPKASQVTVDFDEYNNDGPALFFVGPHQKVRIREADQQDAHFIYYNRDFYCIQIHDAEVACDGILFNNIYNLPRTLLSDNESLFAENLYVQIKEELIAKESSQEEMIRTYLKQLIIRATRAWKKQQLGKLNDEPAKEMEFFRDFSRLVEIHFRKKHGVADYADLLNMAPKTLSAKFNRLNLASPNEIIKDRIVLEAKRLLCYSKYNIKEIAYHLGYEDPAYFNRLFTSKTGLTPAFFKKNNHKTEKVQ